MRKNLWHRVILWNMGGGYYVGIFSMFGKLNSLKNTACRNIMTTADFDAVKKEKGINYMQEKMK